MSLEPNQFVVITRYAKAQITRIIAATAIAKNTLLRLCRMPRSATSHSTGGVRACIRRVAGLATSTGFAGHASRPHAATSHQPPRIAIAEFEKTSLVAKLKAARDRKRAATGKCGGRKTYPEARPDDI